MTTKSKTTKPKAAPTGTTSARFKKLVAGTAVEPTAISADAPQTRPAEPAKPPRAPKAKPTTAAGDLAPTSVKTLAAAYVAHLQTAGKSLSTIASYAADLEVAVEHFGATRDTTTITTDEVATFDACALVTHKRSGAPRAKPTILKTRRVLRLALVWAQEAGLVTTIPYATKAAG